MLNAKKRTDALHASWCVNESGNRIEADKNSLVLSTQFLFISGSVNSNLVFNFTQWFSLARFYHIYQHVGLHQTRESIQKRENERTSVKDRVSKFRKIESSNLAKVDTNHWGKGTLELIAENRWEKENEQEEKTSDIRGD